MICKEQLYHLLTGLNKRDQEAAYNYIKSLARRGGQNPEEKKAAEVKILGSDFYVIGD